MQLHLHMKIAELKRLSEAASVRGTEKQDTAIAATDQPWNKHRWVRVSGAAGIALVALVAWLSMRGPTPAMSSQANRLRIATVSNGRFVRDVAAQGTVIAAVTRQCSRSPWNRQLLGASGRRCDHGQVLATLESPELNNEYQREHATLDSLNAALERQGIEIRRQLLTSKQQADLAQVAITAAQRELKRAQWPGTRER